MSRKNPAAVALGKRGGKVKSEAKAASSRENGKKGGRPKKEGRAFGAVCDPTVGVLPAEAPHMRWEGVADVTSFAENNVRVTRYVFGDKEVTRAQWVRLADKHGLCVPDWIRAK